MPPGDGTPLSPWSKPSLTARIMSVSSFSTGKAEDVVNAGAASSESKSATSSVGVMPFSRQVYQPPSAAMTHIGYFERTQAGRKAARADDKNRPWVIPFLDIRRSRGGNMPDRGLHPHGEEP